MQNRQLALIGVFGVVGMVGLSPLVAALVPAPVLIDALIWLTRGAIASISPFLNVGHLYYLMYAMRTAAGICGLTALKNGLDTIAMHVDNTREDIRCVLFSVGAAYMHTLYGAPHSSAALKVLEPADAFAELVAAKRYAGDTPHARSAASSFLASISARAWRQLSPFTILRTLWWSSGWTMHLLLQLAR